jgi:hypothetical protein
MFDAGDVNEVARRTTVVAGASPVPSARCGELSRARARGVGHGYLQRGKLEPCRRINLPVAIADSQLFNLVYSRADIQARVAAICFIDAEFGSVPDLVEWAAG